MKLRQQTIFRSKDGKVFKGVQPPRGSVKVWKDETDDGVEATHIRVPISSTSEDRDGDEFTESGIEETLEQLKSGEVPLFLDHGISPATGFQDYRALEAIGGWKDGEIEDGVVFGIAALDPDKNEALELSKTLENGIVPVGWSVGFIPRETEEKGDDGEGLRFVSHDLLEVSAVGIPSNPDGVSASLTLAAKSFAEMRGVPIDGPELGDGISRAFDDAIARSLEKIAGAVGDLVEQYLETVDDDADPTLADFVAWAQESAEEQLDEITAAIASYVEENDVDEPAEAPLEDFVEWLGEDGDDEDDDDEDDAETEAGDGDEDDDEDDDKDGDGDDSGTAPSTLDVDALVAELEGAFARALEQHRDLMLEALSPDETESDDDEDDEDDEDDDKSQRGAAKPRGIGTFAGSDLRELGFDDGDDSTDEDDGTDEAPVENHLRFNPERKQ